MDDFAQTLQTPSLDASPLLGIGILTYNRQEKLRQAIKEVRLRTSQSFHLVVADDGSSDGTTNFLQTDGVTRIVGRNMGVCWNKNRLLYFLSTVLNCETILLLEDDCYPTEQGWERPWVEAVRRHGHINLAGGWFDHLFLGGSGTPEDPVRCKAISGQCVGYARRAVQQVGYFDTRFRGYGIGHVEHSWRMALAGHGGSASPDSGDEATYLLINSAIRVDGEQSESGRNEEALACNQALFAETRREGMHRWAWRTDDEMRQFLAEIDAARETVTASCGQWSLAASDDALGSPHMFGEEHKLYADTLSRHGARYMEFGMGGSTVVAARHPNRQIVAVDSDVRWVDKVRSQPDVASAIRTGRVSLLHADLGPLGEWGFPADPSRAPSWSDYVRLPWLEWDARGARPTLIFVDGRFRVACCLSIVAALGAWRGAGESPRVLLHDFNGARPFYRSVLDFFEIEAVENTLHLLRMREDASPMRAMAEMMGALCDPR